MQLYEIMKLKGTPELAPCTAIGIDFATMLQHDHWVLVALLGKIIAGVGSTIPDKAQIAVEGADHLFKEIRVENTLQDKNGNPYLCSTPESSLPFGTLVPW